MVAYHSSSPTELALLRLEGPAGVGAGADVALPGRGPGSAGLFAARSATRRSGGGWRRRRWRGCCCLSANRSWLRQRRRRQTVLRQLHQVVVVDALDVFRH